jgi:hypothetical protein
MFFSEGRICHGSYHWRCIRPDTLSHYGENTHYICGKCTESVTTTTTRPNPTQRLTNGGIKIKSPNLSETDYRDFANIPSKLNSAPTKDTTVGNTIRYFEEQQQQQQQQPAHRISKPNEFDEYVSPQTNGKKINTFALKIYF